MYRENRKNVAILNCRTANERKCFMNASLKQINEQMNQYHF
jgi:hypothetical protein